MEVAILLYEGFTALDAVGPYEVLSRVPGARVRFVATEAGPVRADSGMLTLWAEAELDHVSGPEVIVVPGGAAGTFSVLKDERVLQWVRTAHETTRWTTSVCSGALILGAAGLLVGKRASTHWLVANRLSGYGAVHSGKRIAEEGRIMTAAGVSAGVDMALRSIAGRCRRRANRFAAEQSGC
jgi:putative intracellular protease/amidase